MSNRSLGVPPISASKRPLAVPEAVANNVESQRRTVVVSQLVFRLGRLNGLLTHRALLAGSEAGPRPHRVLEGQDAGVEFLTHDLSQWLRQHYCTYSTSSLLSPSKGSQHTARHDPDHRPSSSCSNCTRAVTPAGFLSSPRQTRPAQSTCPWSPTDQRQRDLPALA